MSTSIFWQKVPVNGTWAFRHSAGMTSQQSAFVEAYMVDFSATSAARRIGCDDPRDAGVALLRSPGVGEAIASRMVAPTRPRVSVRAELRKALRHPLLAARDTVKLAAQRRGWELRRIGEASVVEGAGLVHAFHRGRCFYCLGKGPASHAIATGGEWDAHFKRILFARAQRGPGTVVEVGANVGASFIPVCAELPHMRFVMFEPTPSFFAVLQKNRESFGATNATLDCRAVSDGSSDAMLLLYDDESGGIATAGAAYGRYNSVVAPTTSLDQAFPTAEIAMLKVDVDGFDWDVLRGGERLIRRSKPDVLLEFSPTLMALRGVQPMAVLDFLAGCGLTSFDVYSAHGTFLETTKDEARVVWLATHQKAPKYVDIHARPA